MQDSIEIQGGDKNQMNSSADINQLKQGLKQDSSFQNDFQEKKDKTQNNNDEIVNYKIIEPDQIQNNNNKNSKSLQNKRLSKKKNAYSNFIKNIRANTPVLNSISTINNPNKNKIRSSSSFSRTLNNFFTKNKILFNDDDDNTSIINDDPIKLRNQFQHYLGKANDKITKEVSFKKCKEIITKNHSNQDLRVYISCLSTYCRNATVIGMEIYALLYGYISGVYKENLMDPIDNPPNIIKTINRILSHLRQYYLISNSYMVHKSSSRAICDIYDNCMPKDNIKSIYMIFFEPFFEILSSGTGKSTQEGAAICLMDFIYHLGENQKKNNINKKILDTIDDKVIALCTKSSLDNPYIFEALYNLINFNKIENYSNYLKEIYDRFVLILCKTNKNKYNYLMKLNCLKILNLIGMKIRNIADISIGYYQDEVYKVIEYNTKDKNAKVQIEAKKTLKTWKELKQIYEDIDNKKREIKDDINKDTFLNNNIINKKISNNNEDEDDDVTNENNNFNNTNETLVKKMDKLNFLRNLAKRAKIENQKIDYDSQLPEKMKEEVYKKGISNILNLSKFLKHKLQNKENEELKKEEVSPNRKNKKTNLQNEIKDYLKHSKQVKKYDSIQKMQRDNINAKNRTILKKNKFYENEENIINEEVNEENYNNNNEIENDTERNDINNNINNNQIKENIIENENNNQNNFKEEEQFQGQNYRNENVEENLNEENDNYNNNINYEEDKNQEEIIQENENPPLYQNKQINKKIKKKKNKVKEIKQIKNDNINNNKQISDTKSYTNDEINKEEKEKFNPNSNIIMNINKKEQTSNVNNIKEVKDNDTNKIKINLQNMFNEIMYNSIFLFEKNVTEKLNKMNNRINDISLKISDYQCHPNNVNNNLNNSTYSKKSKKKYIENTYSVSSYKPENNTSFYINSKKMKLNKDSKNQSINTEEDFNFYINNRNFNKNENNIDSEVTKAWKETLKLIEKGNLNEGYLKLINTGDDIYLLRLICLTGPIIDKLDAEIAKRVLIRVNMISKSHQIQQLLIGLIRNSIKSNVFQMLEINQQNYILDSLYEFSGLNNSIATEAAELYAQLTK